MFCKRFPQVYLTSSDVFVFLQENNRGREEMKKTILCLAVSMLLFVSMLIGLPRVSASSSSVVSLVPTDETTANSQAPNMTDSGSIQTLVIWCSNAPFQCYGWFKFNITSLLGTSIKSVLFYTYCYPYDVGMIMLAHHSPNITWTEKTLTWANQPAFDSAYVESAQINSSGVNQWIPIDVTNIIQNDVKQGNRLATLVLTQLYINTAVAIFSKNYSPAYYPYLAVEKTPLTVSASPSSIILPIGGSQTFTCTASNGTTPYTYNWYVNNQLVESGSSNVADLYTFTAQQSEQGTNVTIQCQVTDSADEMATANAIVYVPLPNGQVANVNASDGKLGLQAILWHWWQEGMPQYDYYAVEVSLYDLKYANCDGSIISPAIHPFKTVIELQMNSFCSEWMTPDPQQGDYGASGQSFSFSVAGVGFSITGSAYRVFFSQGYNTTSNKYICQWTLEFGTLYGTPIPSGYPWTASTQVAVGIRVPAEHKPTVIIGVDNIWDSHKENPICLRWMYYDSDFLWSPPLDPAGSIPITPQNTSIPAPFLSQPCEYMSEYTETINTTRPCFFHVMMLDTTSILDGQYTIVSITSIVCARKQEQITTDSVILMGNQSDYNYMPAVPRAGFAVEV